MNTIPVKRPPFLSALCNLTFIGSSIGFLGYFLVSLFFEQSTELIIKYSSWHTTEALSPVYFTLLMALYALSLTGAIRMWKLHRDGFLLYTFAQLCILFIPVIWTDWQAFSVTNAIFTLIFVGGYGLNLKRLK
ncbi:hypothetical protein D1164_03605 [Mariniphaga sediminis]|jgi:hypothetical protein|uniref:DUF2127 domain-containing protein n=1 Tax=Mariniphaga sediminis TaxID=1628158 RepID=A0A399D5C5_9BACT|nr:hypothetical protein [Mariniphaga sediminis]RIH66696.1 hypothetical protein D1164_03605 [Mariniphaga sediminis]